MNALLLRLVLAVIRVLADRLDPDNKSSIIQALYPDWPLTVIYKAVHRLEEESEKSKRLD